MENFVILLYLLGKSIVLYKVAECRGHPCLYFFQYLSSDDKLFLCSLGIRSFIIQVCFSFSLYRHALFFSQVFQESFKTEDRVNQIDDLRLVFVSGFMYSTEMLFIVHYSTNNINMLILFSS